MNDVAMQKSGRHVADVSVVIPCHNYGQYLSRAIESVLRQSLLPHQILVIDDASTDATKDVALSFASRGVSYARVEHCDLSKTRNFGTRSTCGSFVLFLDADDHLHDDYIERCLAVCDDDRVGFAYGDVQKFGETDVFRRSPDFDAALLSRSNYICSHALVRRSALELCGGYRSIPHCMEDWDFYRRAVALGFVGKRAETKSFYFIHRDSMLQTHKASPHFTYFNDAALSFQPITIGVVLTKESLDAEALIDDLRNIAFDHALIRLHVCSASPDSTFDASLRQSWLSLPFGSVQCAHVRAHEREIGFALALTRIIQECSTEYLWLMSGDAISSPHTLPSLLASMNPSAVAIAACDQSQLRSSRIFDSTLFRIHPLKSLLPFQGSSSLCEESFRRLLACGQIRSHRDKAPYP